jgi:hypothetical protein
LSPLQHPRLCFGRQVKDIGDDGDRRLRCKIPDQVRTWRVGKPLDQVLGHFGDAGGELVDRAGSEAL